MITPFHPDILATGPDGEKARTKSLKNLTYAAMYDAKVGKGLGIQISKDGEYFQIDWSLIELPWEPNPEMEARLAQVNPFRPASEKRLDSFLFAGASCGLRRAAVLIVPLAVLGRMAAHDPQPVYALLFVAR